MNSGIPKRLDDDRILPEFLHHLHDTLILLGADAEFAELIEFPDSISSDKVDDLRRYNCKLINDTKRRLVNINKLVVELAG